MLAALRQPNYRLWAAADLISITGTWMQVLAINWYVLTVTGSPTSMGLTVLLQALPAVFLGPLGGALADRFPARPLLIASQLTHALLAASLAVVAGGAAGHVWAVYALATCGGVVSALEGPVMGRFNSTIVDRATLGNAISLGSVVNSSGRILGMALGGLVVAAGTSPLFAANALSFAAVIGALCVIRPASLHRIQDPVVQDPVIRDPVVQDPVREPGAGRPVAGVREGLRYLRRQPVVLLVLGLSVVLGSLGRNYQITMAAMSAGPLHAGAGGYALLSSAFAAGTIGGGLLAAGRRVLGLRTLVGLGLVTSLGQVLAGLSPTVTTMAVLVVPIAAGAVMIDTITATRIQLDTLGAMRGRVLGFAAAASGLAGAFGAPLLGWLCEHLGARTTLVGAGLLVATACAAGGYAMARLRGLPRSRRQVRLLVGETLGLPEPRPVPGPSRVALRREGSGARESLAPGGVPVAAERPLAPEPVPV